MKNICNVHMQKPLKDAINRNLQVNIIIYRCIIIPVIASYDLIIYIVDA